MPRASVRNGWDSYIILIPGTKPFSRKPLSLNTNTRHGLHETTEVYLPWLTITFLALSGLSGSYRMSIACLLRVLYCYQCSRSAANGFIVSATNTEIVSFHHLIISSHFPFSAVFMSVGPRSHSTLRAIVGEIRYSGPIFVVPKD